MGYPEPIPVLKGKAAKEFLQKLENFSLTPEQKKFYRDAIERHDNKCKPDCAGRNAYGQCIGCSRFPGLRDKYKKA